MLTLNCPACGAEVTFRSRASVFGVCSYCQSTLVRHDMDLEAVGKMAELQYDMSPIQLMTTGYFDGDKFDVVGRLRVGYAEGFWNEWYCYFGGDRLGWLAEAQGFFAMCFPEPSSTVPARGEIRPGRVITFGERGVFEVHDLKDVKCVFSEGELPFNAGRDRESLSVDLSGSGRQMATIEYAKADSSVRVFVGEYVDFDDFKFRNLRRIDGW